MIANLRVGHYGKSSGRLLGIFRVKRSFHMEHEHKPMV